MGVAPVGLLCFTDRRYNPAEEFRIASNYPAIAYAWETKYK
jgi:dTDP-4-dehydrorhamnose 3,5-epimerase-like enzyme